MYVNNLTSSRAQALHEKLTHYEPYIGYIPATYSSRVKDWLSAAVSCIYLKIGERWLSADDEEDDIIEDVDHNVPGWPLVEYGYTNSTIRPLYFHHFLGYKIERAVYPGFESDTRFALVAISAAPREIADFRVLVESAKGEYLREESRQLPELASSICLTLNCKHLLLIRFFGTTYTSWSTNTVKVSLISCWRLRTPIMRHLRNC